MAWHRSIIFITCSIVLGSAIPNSEPHPECIHDGREFRENRVPEQRVHREDSQKTLKLRVARQVRTSDEPSQESSTFETDASRRVLEEAETSRNQVHEETWSLAEEIMRSLDEEDAMRGRNRSTAVKIHNRKVVEAPRNETGEYETFVGSAEYGEIRENMERLDYHLERAEARRIRLREYHRRYRERRKLELMKNPEKAEARRMSIVKSYRSYRKRQMIMEMMDPEGAKAHRMQRNEYFRQYRERKKAKSKENPAEEEAQRMKRREQNQRREERLKVEAAENPDAAEARRMKRREKYQRRKERLKVEAAENPDAAEARRMKRRENDRRRKERQKVEATENPDAAQTQ